MVQKRFERIWILIWLYLRLIKKTPYEVRQKIKVDSQSIYDFLKPTGLNSLGSVQKQALKMLDKTLSWLKFAEINTYGLAEFIYVYECLYDL